MSEQFDLEALEKVLTKKERGKKEEPKKRKSDKPLFVAVDKEGNEVAPKDMKVGKAYGFESS